MIVRILTHCAVMAVILSACLMPVVRADKPLRNQSLQLLLLRNGRIVIGKIDRGTTGFVVTKTSGRLVIPFEDVKLLANSFDDAYQKQKNAMNSPDPIAHMELARWSLKHELYDATSEQLNGALSLNPGYEPAIRMLKRLDGILKTTDGKNRSPSTNQKVGNAVLTENSNGSLYGISQQSVNDFAQVVQPLMMNRCANASCHGPHASNKFRLARVRSGRRSNRALLRRNLSTTLAVVDAKRGQDSRLLTVFAGQTRHRQKLVFSGQSGGRQFEAIRNWVLRVAKELGERNNQKNVARQTPEANSQTASQNNSFSDGPTTLQKKPSTLAPRKPNPSTADVFDPNVFNNQLNR